MQSIVEELVCYLYLGKATINSENAFNYLLFALRYQLQELSNATFEYLRIKYVAYFLWVFKYDAGHGLRCARLRPGIQK